MARPGVGLYRVSECEESEGWRGRGARGQQKVPHAKGLTCQRAPRAADTDSLRYLSTLFIRGAWSLLSHRPVQFGAGREPCKRLCARQGARAWPVLAGAGRGSAHPLLASSGAPVAQTSLVSIASQRDHQPPLWVWGQAAPRASEGAKGAAWGPSSPVPVFLPLCHADRAAQCKQVTGSKPTSD